MINFIINLSFGKFHWNCVVHELIWKSQFDFSHICYLKIIIIIIKSALNSNGCIFQLHNREKCTLMHDRVLIKSDYGELCVRKSQVPFSWLCPSKSNFSNHLFLRAPCQPSTNIILQLGKVCAAVRSVIWEPLQQFSQYQRKIKIWIFKDKQTKIVMISNEYK